MSRAARLKAARREWRIEKLMKRGGTREQAIAALDESAANYGRSWGHAGGAKDRRKALGQIGD